MKKLFLLASVLSLSASSFALDEGTLTLNLNIYDWGLGSCKAVEKYPQHYASTTTDMTVTQQRDQNGTLYNKVIASFTTDSPYDDPYSGGGDVYLTCYPSFIVMDADVVGDQFNPSQGGFENTGWGMANYISVDAGTGADLPAIGYEDYPRDIGQGDEGKYNYNWAYPINSNRIAGFTIGGRLIFNPITDKPGDPDMYTGIFVHVNEPQLINPLNKTH